MFTLVKTSNEVIFHIISVNYKTNIYGGAGAGLKWWLRLQPNTPALDSSSSETLGSRLYVYRPTAADFMCIGLRQQASGIQAYGNRLQVYRPLWQQASGIQAYDNGLQVYRRDIAVLTARHNAKFVCQPEKARWCCKRQCLYCVQ